MTTFVKPLGSQEMAWNFRLVAQHELGGFGGMGEGMSIQLAQDGRRIMWLAHESAPEELHRRRRHGSDEPDASWFRPSCPNSYALELARSGGRHHGGRLPDQERRGRSLPASSCSTSRCRKIPGRSPSSIASGPHSRGVHQLWFVRRRIRAHVLGRARLPAAQPARRPDLSHLRRARSVEAEGGRALVAARHTRRRRRAAAGASSEAEGRFRLPRAQHQRLSPAARPRLSRLSRRRRDHARHRRQGATRRWSRAGTTRRLSSDSRTRCCRCSTATSTWSRTNACRTTRPTGQSSCGSSMPADEANPVPIATLPAPPTDAVRASGRPLRRAQCPRERAAPDILAVGSRSSSAPSSTRGVRAYDISDPYPAARSRLLRAGSAAALAHGHDPAQRRVRRRARHRLHRRSACRRPVHPRDGILRPGFASTPTGYRCRCLILLFALRIVGASARFGPSLDFRKRFAQFAANAIKRDGAQDKVLWRVVRLDGFDDSLRGPNGIPRLLAAIACRRLKPGADGALVIRNGRASLLQGAAGPIGSEWSRLHADDLDAERGDLPRKGVGKASTACLVAA